MTAFAFTLPLANLSARPSLEYIQDFCWPVEPTEVTIQLLICCSNVFMLTRRLFSDVITNNAHVLYPLVPPLSRASQQYNLRRRIDLNFRIEQTA